MKPAVFEYDAPHELDDALALLAEHGDEAKVLAGGQSLVPLMNLRLATPERLVDLRRVDSLQAITISATHITTGAMARQRMVETHPEVMSTCPLLVAALRHVAHVQIRERGTVCGSIAHADPAAELPLLAALLDAQVRTVSAQGRRTIAARDFFVTVMTTRLAPDEIIEDVAWPRLGATEGWAFEEFTRRPGDFAVVAAAVTVVLDGERYSSARVGVSGVSDVPVLVDAGGLVGEVPEEALWHEVAGDVAARLTPSSDIQASAEDRRELAAVLIERCVRTATARARAAHRDGAGSDG
jgi:carbon-monoxide dehydrogenase medium subunit